jgi:hypothetical protein
MEKVQASRETVHQIVMDICCINVRNKKKPKKAKKNNKLIETDIDIFADDKGKGQHKI